MYTNVVQIITVFVLILNSKGLVKAQTAVNKDIAAKPPACYNPNKHLGQCISIYECNSLRYVLEHKLQPLYAFARASECSGGKGKPPFVCCTRDIRFEEDLTTRSRSQRIIFPDELQRNKTRSERHESSTERSTTESSTTDMQKFFSSTESQRQNNTEKTSEETSTATVNKFPKPPNCGGLVFSNKIYGGKAAELGEFSWMVILEYRNLTTGQLLMDCSGSIINKRYVLTAAHCVEGDILEVNGRLESVRIGEHDTDTDLDCNETNCRPKYQRLRIESVIPHADYDAKNKHRARNQHDIALLRLERPVQFDDDLQPACLPNVEPLKPLAFREKFTVAGWGHNGSRKRTAIKQKVELPYVQHDECRNIFKKKFFLADEQLCAGGRFREDSCSGDSGGPLMRLGEDYWVLDGIVSFGLGCGLERPAVYTDVRHYLQWIDEHVRSD